jgi:hypothetical protein
MRKFRDGDIVEFENEKFRIEKTHTDHKNKYIFCLNKDGDYIYFDETGFCKEDGREPLKLLMGHSLIHQVKAREKTFYSISSNKELFEVIDWLENKIEEYTQLGKDNFDIEESLTVRFGEYRDKRGKWSWRQLELLISQLNFYFRHLGFVTYIGIKDTSFETPKVFVQIGWRY